MSDDNNIIGEALDPDEMTEAITITEQDIQDAIDWWNENASDLYIGALEQ